MISMGIKIKFNKIIKRMKIKMKIKIKIKMIKNIKLNKKLVNI